VYDLRQLWRSLGPRQEPVVKPAEPGRNDPCWCGSAQCRGTLLAPKRGWNPPGPRERA
jgi:hypothetical protein